MDSPEKRKEIEAQTLKRAAALCKKWAAEIEALPDCDRPANLDETDGFVWASKLLDAEAVRVERGVSLEADSEPLFVEVPTPTIRVRANVRSVERGGLATPHEWVPDENGYARCAECGLLAGTPQEFEQCPSRRESE